MGDYNPKWYAFKIESSRHILDLTIEPSFARAVCFQFHQMQDNSYKIFWNFAMSAKEFSILIKQYAEDYKIDIKTPLLEVIESEEFAKFIKQHSKIYKADLSEENMELVKAVIKADWAPIKYTCGLDGHSYCIKIYGEKVREYRCWCDIPNEWADLIPLVNLLIELANLQPDYSYRVSYIDGKSLKAHKEKISEITLKLPPWMEVTDNNNKGD